MPKYTFTANVVDVNTGVENAAHGDVTADSDAEAITKIDRKFRELGVRRTGLTLRAPR